MDLRRKGKYITGWLRMDSVDEPVTLKDNSYFLTRDATGKKNVNGAIFMDAGTRLETRPYTVILYGHNMKTGNMFGRLRKYRDISYLRKNRFITFDTMYEDGRYAVFAAAEINVVPGTSGYFRSTTGIASRLYLLIIRATSSWSVWVVTVMTFSSMTLSIVCRSFGASSRLFTDTVPTRIRFSST